MPCTFTGSLDGDLILSLREALDERERMLCGICTVLERDAGLAGLNQFFRVVEEDTDGMEENELSLWWQAHKRAEE